MGMFACHICVCAENTALGSFWRKGEKLCSECESGKWHGRFPKRSAIGWSIDNEGKIWRPDQVEEDQVPKHLRIVGIVQKI